MRRPGVLQEYIRKVDWGAAWICLLCFGLVAYLGLKGGGYDPLVHDQVGIAGWWVLLAGVLVGALPRRRPTKLAWIAIGLLAAFVVWTALSLTWTESTERTGADLARVCGYLGIFVLVILSRERGDIQRILTSVAAGIVLVALVGMLSRLHPAWFPAAADTGRFLDDPERLSYPLNYWNGMGGLIAIGLPLLLQIATSARSVVGRALAAAALPAMMLTIFMTLSRGGIAAAVIALALFLVLTSDRLPKILTLLVVTAGAAVLIAALEARDALQEGLLNDAAHQQGNELLWITLAVCLVVGLVQAALANPRVERARPAWTRVPKQRALLATAGAVVVLLIVALAVGAPGRVSNGWDEFRDGGGAGSGAGRLGSVAGQSRYQLWSAAMRENRTDPLIGTGSGTFEYWWARDGDTDETVRDTHSLYLQTLGELGIVGAALLAAFLAVFLIGGTQLLASGTALGRSQLAAAIAGFIAFCITAVFDWMWQIPVLPVSMLLLGAVMVGGAAEPRKEDGKRGAALPLPLRLGAAAIALVAIVAMAIPLASSTLVRQSEADARGGDLSAALEKARSAQNVQPGAATPRLQQALVLEAEGELDAAAEAARAATERESTNWRTWLVLSRIEAERGKAAASVDAYREARSLNPRSELFVR